MKMLNSFLIFLLLEGSASVLAALSLSPFEIGSGSLGNRLLFINTTCEDEGFLSESVLPDVKLALNVVNDALPAESTLNIDMLHVDAHVSLKFWFCIQTRLGLHLVCKLLNY